MEFWHTYFWLADVLYAIFERRKIPRNWKAANVKSLLKSGKPDDNPTNYHLIIFLSML